MRKAVTITQHMNFGPAMTALTPKRRAFVMALNNAGGKNATEAARAAGFKDTEFLRTSAYMLLHDPRIQAAIVEDTRARFSGQAGELNEQLTRISQTPGPQQLNAIKMMFHHIGLQEKQVVEHNHTITLTLAQKIEKVNQLRAAQGKELIALPATTVTEPLVTDAEFTEIEDEPVEDTRPPLW
jgi:hypothetical protein